MRKFKHLSRSLISFLSAFFNERNHNDRFFHKLLVYLGLVESLGVTLLNVTLVLLIASGEEVHTRGPYTKHVNPPKAAGT